MFIVIHHQTWTKFIQIHPMSWWPHPRGMMIGYHWTSTFLRIQYKMGTDYIIRSAQPAWYHTHTHTDIHTHIYNIILYYIIRRCIHTYIYVYLSRCWFQGRAVFFWWRPNIPPTWTEQAEQVEEAAWCQTRTTLQGEFVFFLYTAGALTFQGLWTWDGRCVLESRWKRLRRAGQGLRFRTNISLGGSPKSTNNPIPRISNTVPNKCNCPTKSY